MIAIDTNILVRLFTNDNKKQAAYAVNLIQNNPIFISKSVLLETECVLRYSYELEQPVVFKSFEMLLGLPNISIEDPTCVIQTLRWYEEGFDFADALHLASSQHADKFATLDMAFIKKARTQHIQMISMSTDAVTENETP